MPAALARDVIASMPGDAPMLVNSAGCGAAMKEYGHLLGTPEAEAFSARVRDVHEWLAERVERASAATSGTPAGDRAGSVPPAPRATGSGSLRRVLSRYVDVVELDDEGLCCGAGGAYSALQPELAGAIRERKIGAIERAIDAKRRHDRGFGANPGCAMHLACSRRSTARHPIDLVAEAIGVQR